ncbi:DUF397 domain-containing protein [Streptomyces sp. NPDC088124]|uniref:DUF397 domain-containing protein n=1 Tax=Streptomyces sp. NPDC088124 TaxID=3154654 RepID=UPI003435B9B4
MPRAAAGAPGRGQGQRDVDEILGAELGQGDLAGRHRLEEEALAEVLVATCLDAVHVRDSKVRQGPQLALAPEVWSSFLSYATRGRA